MSPLKKFILYFVLFTVILIGFLVYFFLQGGIFVGGKPESLPVSRIVPTSQQQGGKITIADLNDGTRYYFVTGHFVKQPEYMENKLNIRGDFIIDGDPGNNPVSVILTTVGNARVNFGTVYSNSSKEEFVLTATDEVRKQLLPQAQVQLRILVSNSKDPAILSLEQIQKGNWEVSKNLILAPILIALVKQM